METSYCLWDGVKYRSELFGGLVFVPHRSLVVELNHLAYKIVDKIGTSGSATVDEICATVSTVQPEFVEQFVNQLVHSEVFKEA